MPTEEQATATTHHLPACHIEEAVWKYNTYHLLRIARDMHALDITKQRPSIISTTFCGHQLYTQHRSKGCLLRRPDLLDPDVVVLLITSGHDASLNLLEINVGNLSLITIEDTSNLLESRTAGLDVKDGDEDEFEEDPALLLISMKFKNDACDGSTYGVDGVELPGGLEMLESKGVDVLVDGQSNLNEQVHDHETLGTNLEGQDLDSVSDEQT
jgi:hypothetical protein